MKDSDVVVVGGAVGGTSTALLLAELGASVTLLERVADPASVGAGILLQPNGLAVLTGLSLAEQLNSSGHRMHAGAVRSASGRPISAISIENHGPGFGHVLALRRSRLMEVLVEAVAAHPSIVVRLGSDVTAARPDGSVEVRSALGTSTIEADLVVGADGIRSTVRAGGDFGVHARQAGVSYVRGLVESENAGLDGEYWTSLGLFGGAPMGDGSTYFYASADAPAVARAVAAKDLAMFRSLWKEALPPSAPVLDVLTSFDQLLVNEVVRVDCDRWSDGRLVLLGDAAHAMAPTLGQGANSALVDAAVLAIELAAVSTDGLQHGLDRYEGRRRPAVRRVQNQADRLAKLSGMDNKTMRTARDAVLRFAGRLPGAAERLMSTAQQEGPAGLYASVSRLTAPARDG